MSKRYHHVPERTFDSLAVGDTFDFVSYERTYNSFWCRCVKVDDQQYMAEGYSKPFHVGTVKVEVFGVEKERKDE